MKYADKMYVCYDEIVLLTLAHYPLFYTHTHTIWPLPLKCVLSNLQISRVDILFTTSIHKIFKNIPIFKLMTFEYAF